MQWWEQAEAARKRARKPWCVVLAKARVPQPGQPRGWAQMSIEQWKVLREYIRQLEAIVSTPGPPVSPELLRRKLLTSAELADNPVSIPRRQAS